MVDRRQVLRGLLLAGAGLALPAGCGVPSGGPPIVDGAGLTFDPASKSNAEPPDPSQATTPTRAVSLFLAAISGSLETADLRVAARERARKFLTGRAGTAWKPGTDQVTVVRVEDLTPSTSGRDVTTVVGRLQPVGVLDPLRGVVQPYPDGGTGAIATEFTVVPDTNRSGRYLIDRLPLDILPAGLLLSTDALDDKQYAYYAPQMIYFWDNNGHGELVPDLRYVPRAGIPDSQQKAYIVNWLIGDPSELIGSVAQSIVPSGTQLKTPNVLTVGNRLVVNLIGALQGQDLQKNVMAQLRWSLHPPYPFDGPIELQIASHAQLVDSAVEPYRAGNPAERDRNTDPQAFCIVGGAVAPVDSGYGVPPVLGATGSNRIIVQAALSRDKRRAALITSDHRLRIAQAREDGTTVSVNDVPLTGQRWSRPAFLPSGRRLLVVVDGVLYAVTGSTGVSKVMENVAAFAVSPDGYRIAVVSRGGVGVSVVRATDDRLSIGALRPLDAGRRDVTGVAWNRLDRVIVAGRTAEWYGLSEVSVDGAILTSWTSTFKSPIASVVAYPKLPSQVVGSGPVMVQTDDGEAFRAFPSGTPLPLTTQDPSPRPSPSGSAPPVQKPPPTAPFYAD